MDSLNNTNVFKIVRSNRGVNQGKLKENPLVHMVQSCFILWARLSHS